MSIFLPLAESQRVIVECFNMENLAAVAAINFRTGVWGVLKKALIFTSFSDKLYRPKSNVSKCLIHVSPQYCDIYD